MSGLKLSISSNETTAILQADSTTQGALVPRMSTAQRDAIASPATGLLIFNTTTSQHEEYTGAVWQAVGGGAGGDVSGPGGGSTDEAIARWNGVGGDTLQDSAVTIDDSGNMQMADAQLRRPEIRDYAETTVTADSGANYTINLENGNVYDIQLTANCTFVFSNPPASGIAGSFSLLLHQCTGSSTYSVTWPTGTVKWAGGSAPTLSTGTSAIDILTFLTVTAGAIWYGFLAGADFS